MKYYSQIGQDEYYINNIANGRRGGFFLDIGANDGRFGSNTAALEYNYNWTGICIEANPNLIQSLKDNRPNSTIVHKAVWKETGSVQIEIPLHFKKDIPGNQLGRITNVPDLDERNNLYFKKQFDKGTEIFTVQSDTVTNILNEIIKLPVIIDYMSLDTEGAEMEALESIDFNRIDIKFMTIEHGNRKGYKKMFEQYLKQFGYRVHRVNQWDIEFERKF
jgi:FkbM family methyltransferase